MAEPDTPKLYLITPAEIELSRFPDQLAAALDAHETACLRLWRAMMKTASPAWPMPAAR